MVSEGQHFVSNGLAFGHRFVDPSAERIRIGEHLTDLLRELAAVHADEIRFVVRIKHTD